MTFQLNNVTIVSVHEMDAHYPIRDQLIGLTGTVEVQETDATRAYLPEGYITGSFVADTDSILYYFIAVKVVQFNQGE